MNLISSKRLYPTNEQVKQRNEDYMQSTGYPLARIASENTSDIALPSSNNDSALGLFNGSLGTIRYIIYATNARPLALPLFILGNSIAIGGFSSMLSSYLKVKKINNRVAFDGIDFKFLCSVIQNLKNVQYEIIEPVEKVFGIKLDNGTWNGVIGRIQRKEADLGAISLYATYDRFQVVKFTAHVSGSRVIFVVSGPKQLSKLTTIIRPFSFEVWICVFAALFVTAIAFYSIVKGNVYFLHKTTSWTMKKICWFLIRSLISQGNEINQDKSTSSRIIIGIWLLVTTVLISAYSGVLFSYMAYPAYEKVPRTIEELSNAVKNHEYSCGSLSFSAMKKMIMDAPKGMVTILGDYIRNNPDKSFPTLKEGIKYTLQHKHAYIISDNIVNSLSIGQKGILVNSEESFSTCTIAFPMKKKFKFEKEFNKIIRRLVDNGIYEKLKQKDLPSKRSNNKEKYHPLSMEDISSALILLLCGYNISFIILLVEKLLKRK
ncbi:glutamate receptor ionotropic, kainate glr-3-like [Centruroides vittatus]|uniref:glutamate receptor ionotropic, kainate glr-3-like n=1 Tax=Centruroides vittatus TaxID=120091 RepID=UPI00350F72DD